MEKDEQEQQCTLEDIALSVMNSSQNREIYLMDEETMSAIEKEIADLKIK